MKKNSNASASAEATLNEVVENVAVEKEVVESTDKAVATIDNEVEILPCNIFIAEDGTEVEFAVKHFIYAKSTYTVEEAVASIPEALQELYERKSFIFKKV